MESDGENFERSRAIKRSVAVAASVSFAGLCVLRAWASFAGSLRAVLGRRGARVEGVERATADGLVGAFAARVALPLGGAEGEAGAASRRGMVSPRAERASLDAGMATFVRVSAASSDGAEADESDADVLEDDAEAGESDADVLEDAGETGESSADVVEEDAEVGESDADVLEALADEPAFAFDPGEAVVDVSVPLSTLTTSLSGAASVPRSGAYA